MRRLLLTCLILLSSALPALPVRADDPPSPNSLLFCIYGDCRGGHDVHRQIIALMMNYKPALVLQTGDLVADGSKPALWDAYDAITGDMRKLVPFYTARGNHDLGGPGYEQRVPEPIASGNKLYYSVDRANCHFIALDSFSPYAANSPQYRWLQDDLAKAQKRAQHIFVFFHEPPYSIGPHGSNLDERKTLCPLFIRYGVRAVFTGHDHIYYHTTRDHIPYLVTGGGGAPLYPCNPASGAIDGDKWESVNHMIVCQVNGPRVTFTAIRADGSILDQFAAPSPQPQQAPQ